MAQEEAKTKPLDRSLHARRRFSQELVLPVPAREQRVQFENTKVATPTINNMFSDISRSNSTSKSLILQNESIGNIVVKVDFDRLEGLAHTDNYGSEDDDAYLGDKSNRYEEQRLR